MPKRDQGEFTVNEAPTPPAGNPPIPAARGCGFELVRDDATWVFRDTDGALVTRRLRLWLDGNGGLVAVVTEAGTGTCITDAAA